MSQQVTDRPASSGPQQGEYGSHGARVVFDGIAKVYGAVRAVDGVTLDVQPGEFVTFLGPSGSGKTTSLMMLAGFEVPSAGEIYVDGQPVAAIPPHRRNIGMVFQNYALFPHMTVGENIGFPLKIRKLGKDEIRRRTREVLELVKLPGYEGRYPRQLSGGQQQRIAVARALVFNPRVLLMDEPLGALDKQLRERLQLEIKQLHEHLGVTIIYVTHDQQEALVMSDRIAVMNEGRLEQVGSPNDLYEAPQTRFVASFIGESNFLDGVVRKIENGRCQIEVPELGSFATTGREGIALHAPAALTVRPEKIVFGDMPEGSNPTLNRAEGIVEQAIFAGETRRYEIGLGGGARLIVKRQNRSGIPCYERGDRVQVAWHVEDSRLV
jgi:spermidine/putrescine ABC transporter ATP-binding subunit